MVTMSSSMFIPTSSWLSTAGSSASLMGLSPQMSVLPNTMQQQGGSASTTLNQMASLTNTMALTGNLLTQYASSMQMLCQNLNGSLQGSQASYGDCYSQQQTPICPMPQQPVYNYPQPQIPVCPAPQTVYNYPQQQGAASSVIQQNIYNYMQSSQTPASPTQQSETPSCPVQQPVYNYPPAQTPVYSMPQPVYTYPPAQTTITPTPQVDCSCPTPQQQQQPPTYDGGSSGHYWGDPHIEGFDGENYDVMGKGGNTYNMLSDKNVQYNTQFINWGKPGADGVQPTVIGEAGIQVDNNMVYFDRSGDAPTVNGQTLSKDQRVDLGSGQYANWDGETLVVKTKEYTIHLAVKEKDKDGGYLDSTVNINDGVNPLADGVAPHGLLGQTADGVAGEKAGQDGNQDIAKQGGSVIDGTVDDYLVKNLWDNNFKYNRFTSANQGTLQGNNFLQQLLSLLSAIAAELAA